MSEDLPERMSEEMQGSMSEEMPEIISEDMPERVFDDMPERMLDDMPEIVSERMSDARMSEDMPETIRRYVSGSEKCQKGCQRICRKKCRIVFQYMPEILSDLHVMVGVTRSKVNMFCCSFSFMSHLETWFDYIPSSGRQIKTISAQLDNSQNPGSPLSPSVLFNSRKRIIFAPPTFRMVLDLL